MDPTHSEFLATLKATRQAWDRLLGQVPPDQMTMTLPGTPWTLKDIVAHIAWHELQMIGVLKARTLVGSEWWNLPTDARNARIYELNRLRPLDEVLAEARRAYADLLPLVEGLSEAELHDPTQFAQMPPDWQPWKLLAENTYEHYEQHHPQIRAWLTQVT